MAERLHLAGTCRPGGCQRVVGKSGRGRSYLLRGQLQAIVDRIEEECGEAERVRVVRRGPGLLEVRVEFRRRRTRIFGGRLDESVRCFSKERNGFLEPFQRCNVGVVAIPAGWGVGRKDRDLVGR